VIVTIDPDRFKPQVRQRVAEGHPAAVYATAARRHLGAEAEAFLASLPQVATQRVVPQRQSAARPPRVTLPVCEFLGAAAPRQHGVPCGQKRRDCAMFGDCVVYKPCNDADPSLHYCFNSDGSKACPEYVAKGSP
jgi:hypothetical protein